LDGTTRITPSSRDAWRFEVFRCAPSCESAAVLAGGYGTTGDEVRIAIPATVLGLRPDSGLTALRAFTGPGDALSGTLTRFDEVALPDAVIPEALVRFRVLHHDEVVAEATSAPAAGRATALLQGPLAASSYEVEASLCLGSDCTPPRRVRTEV
ncbi:MAG TPA: hypothetical protein VM638_01695, partial [Actinomycetota bacterium]|nr:hypothetical protein [Actinomycetota bacterium]